MRLFESMNEQDLVNRIASRVLEAVREELRQSQQEWGSAQEKRIADAVMRRMFVPNLRLASASAQGAFMAHSTCSAADFFHAQYAPTCAMIGHAPALHRKLWEWAFIIHKLRASGVVRPGARGIVFGVGQERLPALFASLGAAIVATDAPPAIGIGTGWQSSNEYSDSVEKLRCPDIVANAMFDERVAFRFCDMTRIDPDLTGFDFAWSSCSFEHLGSLEAGLQFVIDSVEKTLRPGGVACHTTEFNLSSDEATLSEGPTVIYRRRDILELVERLTALGHDVEPFRIAPDAHVLDFHVDVPPYAQNPHLKLEMMGKFVTTSAGIVIRKH